MRLVLISWIVAAIALSISAQSVPPNTSPSSATKGGSVIGKLNTDRKAPAGKQANQSEYPMPTCDQGSPCFVVIEPKLRVMKHRHRQILSIFSIAVTCGQPSSELLERGSVLSVLIMQTIISRNSSQRQLRAYVLGESGTIVNIANPIQAFPGQIIRPTGAEITNLACGPVARIQIKNTGQTPAFRVEHWGDMFPRISVDDRPSP